MRPLTRLRLAPLRSRRARRCDACEARRFGAAFVVLGAFVALVIGALTPSAAFATQPYEDLFNKGLAEMDAHHYDKACGLFQESLDQGAPVGALLNLADCQDKLGHPARSLELWRNGLAKLPGDDPRRDLAHRSIDDLKRRVANIAVTWPRADASAKAFVDNLPATPNGDPVAVDPGDHKVTLTDSEGSRTIAVTVTAGELKSVDGARAPTGGASSKPSGLVIGGATALAVGGAALIGAAITGGVYLGDESTINANCPTRPCFNDTARAAADDAQVVGAANIAMFVIAGVGVTTGVTLLVIQATKKGDAPKTALTFTGTGFGFSRSF